ncbi:HNH endonuclease signature motif containing protein [Thiocystis violascens]|uniref:HNH endonuclease n=1 Tax=Thiocystis violascens (strain ATCC 17096 / DSM 198 / 6111) TaxID=765911 RepID=I3YEH1_THIV6|nr:HNH endonuclease signature motif containing protein [Thiocystis violascens]AFL75389.1 HNH endonuclease [Thiocystis violascens DSM 198]
MAARYKTTTLGGKPILSHRKVWIQFRGEIPVGYHVHHKNGDPFDNRIENLELLSAADHAARHTRGREPWNKGNRYGLTDAYRRSTISRMANHRKICERTYDLWKSGYTQTRVAEIMGISRRQVCDRLRSYRANCHDD